MRRLLLAGALAGAACVSGCSCGSLTGTWIDASDPDRVARVCAKHGGVQMAAEADTCRDGAFAEIESGYDDVVERYPEAQR